MFVSHPCNHGARAQLCKSWSSGDQQTFACVRITYFRGWGWTECIASIRNALTCDYRREMFVGSPEFQYDVTPLQSFGGETSKMTVNKMICKLLWWYLTADGLCFIKDKNYSVYISIYLPNTSFCIKYIPTFFPLLTQYSNKNYLV